MMRYQIHRRYYEGGPVDPKAEGEAPTLDEAHTWIKARIARASRAGLRLSAHTSFDVVDSWDRDPAPTVTETINHFLDERGILFADVLCYGRSCTLGEAIDNIKHDEMIAELAERLEGAR